MEGTESGAAGSAEEGLRAQVARVAAGLSERTQ